MKVTDFPSPSIGGWTLVVTILAAMITIGASLLALAFLGDQFQISNSTCSDPPSATMANCKQTYTVFQRVPGGLGYFGYIGFSLIFAGSVVTLAIASTFGILYFRSAFKRACEKRRPKAHE